MDVITISGLQFRMRPDITIRHVLDVFRGFGRVGVIQRDGIVEYLDTAIDFTAPDSYRFVDATEIFGSNMQNLQNIQNLQNWQNIQNQTGFQTMTKDVVENRIENQLATNAVNLTAATKWNEIEQSQKLFDLRAQLTNEQLPFMSQNVTLPSMEDGRIKTKFFQHVLLEAPVEQHLNLNHIEILNRNQENIEMKAALESNGIFLAKDALTLSGLQPILGQTGVPLCRFRTAIPGGWIRLGFNENRNDWISRVVLRGDNSLNGSRLVVKKVNEYSVPTFNNVFKYINSYPNDMINVIEIRAPEGRFLQLNEVVINDTQGRRVTDVMKFETSMLSGTRKDSTIQELLFQSSNMNGDFIRSVDFGGFIRMTLTKPVSIQSLQLTGELRDVKVSFERHHSYMCSDDLVQAFAL